jgi:hypothetical protein
MTFPKVCPGCGLEMPSRESARYDGYYNASPECWGVYLEVLSAEYSNAALFGRIHSLTVDAYAAQHTGGGHPDKSVGIHLAGLYLVLDRGLRSPAVPALHQRLAASVEVWPALAPPLARATTTVFDVALATGVRGEPEARARQWAAAVWELWQPCHAVIAGLVNENLPDLPSLHREQS